MLRRAERVREDAERRFLAPLPAAEADALLRALRTLAADPDPEPEADPESGAGADPGAGSGSGPRGR